MYYSFLYEVIKLLTTYFIGSRHATPDTADERVRDLPPRQHQYQPAPRQGQQITSGRQPVRRDHRREERRRMTDEEDTVLDSQDVSSVDHGKKCTFLCK